MKSGEDKEDHRMIMRSGSGGGQVDKEGYVTTLRRRRMERAGRDYIVRIWRTRKRNTEERETEIGSREEQEKARSRKRRRKTRRKSGR